MSRISFQRYGVGRTFESSRYISPHLHSRSSILHLNLVSVGSWGFLAQTLLFLGCPIASRGSFTSQKEWRRKDCTSVHKIYGVIYHRDGAEKHS
ncbi:hypothetical protein BDV26DRAFT_267189 [Aspergillus bertholletiae]|uniref:Uncharacterized protein n=1 Tax=Aspergillus bertholletiae TaxID=1226010 RepID=A0A5N7B0V3_9EURO|nr:hypothetical protein BDV26DRAFT_267189 [Aspergillus bertholletiae]